MLTESEFLAQCCEQAALQNALAWEQQAQLQRLVQNHSPPLDFSLPYVETNLKIHWGKDMQCGHCKAELKIAKKAKSRYLVKGTIALECSQCGFEWITNAEEFSEAKNEVIPGKIDFVALKKKVKHFNLK